MSAENEMNPGRLIGWSIAAAAVLALGGVGAFYVAQWLLAR
jgi:hypothetical protein